MITPLHTSNASLVEDNIAGKNSMHDKIVRTCVALFLRKGYIGTSVSDIANACGIKKGSIYHHFHSKEDMLNSVIDTLEKEFRHNIISVAYDSTLGREKRLSIMLDFITEYIAKHNGNLLTVIAREIEEIMPKTHERISKFYRELTDAFKYIYLQYYDDTRATEISEDLVVRIEGAAMWINISRDLTILARISMQAKQKISFVSV